MRLSSFFFNGSATTEIYTLSLHDALPICPQGGASVRMTLSPSASISTPSPTASTTPAEGEDRKSTRLNSSHLGISYAVFCLKKKIENERDQPTLSQYQRRADAAQPHRSRA